MAALISVSLALSQTPAYTARPRIRVADASRCVPVNVPAFAGTHCAYPRRDGQAEFEASRGFSVAAPAVWNSLPSGVRDASSTHTFRRLLETHCFQQAFGSP